MDAASAKNRLRSSTWNGHVELRPKNQQEGKAPVDPSVAAFKERIRLHYEIASEHYQTLWGEHIHHGYFLEPDDTKERAQIRLIELLISRSKLANDSSILDVGCGLGGTSRYLAKHHDCKVTGITISGKQVEMATNLTRKEVEYDATTKAAGGSTKLRYGAVRFLELDAEQLGQSFRTDGIFDCVWITEALSHLPDKRLFFHNAFKVLSAGGKLVIADWFKAEDLASDQYQSDIKPIEDGMLLPSLCTQPDYVQYAQEAGLSIFSEPLDISEDVAKTWEISWSLVQSPALCKFAYSQGRDGIAFLQAFRAMKRGFSNGTFRYGVMVFQKPN